LFSELQSLHDEVYQLSLNWYNSLPTAQKKKIKEIYGITDMPIPDADIQAIDNGPVWHWFLLNILPLENDFQYRFLTKTSLKERLKQIKRIVLVLLTPHAARPITNSISESNISNANNNGTNSVSNTSSLENVNSAVSRPNNNNNNNNMNNNNNNSNGDTGEN